VNFLCQKESLELHLILYGCDSEIFYELKKNITVHKPKTKFRNNLRLISSFSRLSFLRSKIQSIKPDSILSFGEHWNSFVLIALLGLKYRIMISDRCSPATYLGFTHEILRKWLYSKAFGIIVQTSDAKKIYDKLLKGSRIRVIGNPIREISPNLNIFKENIVLTVGRLIPSKNHAKLIESFISLNKSDWKLVIVGGNAMNLTLMDDLKDLIDKLGAGDQVILTGNRSDVDWFYVKSKIFVLTSQSEGFPNVLGEAMSASLPVVAFDCLSGPSEMVTDGQDGYLVPLHDYEFLKVRLLELMNNAELREDLGNKARQSIKRFSIDKIGEEYFSFMTSKL
jgi:GalNAc-alpha-(1->4)-GalNAc-alpha-(1->3)-diNAcBac-PP-undecaprenol alpha-1,4-N-acetyl-D-galactosaminyltransferase